jgi:hypothetical protein
MLTPAVAFGKGERSDAQLRSECYRELGYERVTPNKPRYVSAQIDDCVARRKVYRK